MHILPHPAALSTSFDPLLRRAFSILSADSEAGSFEMLFRVEGRGTELLSRFEVGDEIDLLGPLGVPFDTSPLFHVKQEEIPPSVWLVGGGVGVPPMVFLGSQLKAAGIEVEAIVGARTSIDVLGLTDFQQLDIPVSVATEDGSLGQPGRVTDVLEAQLEQGVGQVIYSCGPLPMLRAVAALARRYDVRCQVSLEENMPCGVGVCNGCVVATHGDETEGQTLYHRYRRICVDGPTCWSDEIDWN